MKKNKSLLLIGVIMFVIVATIVLIGIILSPYSISQVDIINRLNEPSVDHLMGTDHLGRDLFTRVVNGAGVSIFIGLVVSACSLIIGLTVGLISGYFSKVGMVLMRIVDAIMSFPAIILAIALSGIFGMGMINIIIALVIAYVPQIARVVYNSVLIIKRKEYVMSTLLLGKSHAYVLFSSILPNIWTAILVQVTYIFALSILNESVLSFIGVGIKEPTASLGGLINDGMDYYTVAPWLIFFPGIFISWLILSINIIGDGLRNTLMNNDEREEFKNDLPIS